MLKITTCLVSMSSCIRALIGPVSVSTGGMIRPVKVGSDVDKRLAGIRVSSWSSRWTLLSYTGAPLRPDTALKLLQTNRGQLKITKRNKCRSYARYFLHSSLQVIFLNPPAPRAPVYILELRVSARCLRQNFTAESSGKMTSLWLPDRFWNPPWLMRFGTYISKLFTVFLMKRFVLIIQTNQN